MLTDDGWPTDTVWATLSEEAMAGAALQRIAAAIETTANPRMYPHPPAIANSVQCAAPSQSHIGDRLQPALRWLPQSGHNCLSMGDLRTKHRRLAGLDMGPVSYTHLRAHETVLDLV